MQLFIFKKSALRLQVTQAVLHRYFVHRQPAPPSPPVFWSKNTVGTVCEKPSLPSLAGARVCGDEQRLAEHDGRLAEAGGPVGGDAAGLLPLRLYPPLHVPLRGEATGKLL